MRKAFAVLRTKEHPLDLPETKGHPPDLPRESNYAPPPERLAPPPPPYTDVEVAPQAGPPPARGLGRASPSRSRTLSDLRDRVRHERWHDGDDEQSGRQQQRPLRQPGHQRPRWVDHLEPEPDL